jgi:ferredoxin
MPTLTYSVDDSTFEIPAGTKLLDFCEETDTPHQFGCQVGSCGTCICLISAGAENLNAASEDEKETIDMTTDVEGARLGCQIIINGDVTISPCE